MHKPIVLFIAAPLISLNTVAERNILKIWQQDDLTNRIQESYYSMFDGIKLTKQQLQQMRDLMSLVQHDTPCINVSEMERMYTWMTTKTFDEAAVREQTKKMAQEQIARQIAMPGCTTKCITCLRRDSNKF